MGDEAPLCTDEKLPVTLVTGASGHLGANLVRELVARGQERVRVLIRQGSNNKAVECLDVDRYYGDLCDLPSLIRAMQGCTRVYHLAAFVSIRHGDRQKLFDVNVLGSRNVLIAAKQCAVKRVLHCSSFGAVRNMYPDKSSEAATFNPFEITTDYEMSKAFAEGEVLRVALEEDVDVVIVNPSAIVGPNDFKPSLLGASILAIAKGDLAAYVSGGFDFVPVSDVVDGCIRAMTSGRSGHRYLITGQWCSLDNIIEWISRCTGASRPTTQIPVTLLKIVCPIKDWLERTLFPSSTPRWTTGSIRLLTGGKTADNSKSIRDLGLQPSPVRRAFEEAVEFFLQHGFLHARASTTPAPICSKL